MLVSCTRLIGCIVVGIDSCCLWDQCAVVVLVCFSMVIAMDSSAEIGQCGRGLREATAHRTVDLERGGGDYLCGGAGLALSWSAARWIF